MANDTSSSRCSAGSERLYTEQQVREAVEKVISDMLERGEIMRPSGQPQQSTGNEQLIEHLLCYENGDHLVHLRAEQIDSIIAALTAAEPQTAPEPMSSEEKDLFAAVTKHDLGGAVSHLRSFFSVPQLHHRKQYADLLEAQAKLIAHFVNRSRQQRGQE
ncbi:hypothetical protein ACVWW6_005544 [Bradyrhizobium sp. USDA 3311]